MPLTSWYQQPDMVPKLLTSKSYHNVLSESVAVQDTTAYHIEQGLRLLKAGETSEANEHFELAQLSCACLGDLQRENLGPIYFNQHVASGRSCEAVKAAFAVPELLESFLKYLDVADLLRVQQVSRAMRDAIGASIALKRKLFLVPIMNSHLRVLPLRALHASPNIIIHGKCRLDKGPRKDSDIADPELASHNRHHDVDFRFTGQLRRVGTRIRSMFVTQPPIHEMSMTVQCCAGPAQMGTVIESSGGLTFGQLYDRAEQTLLAHENCRSRR